MNYNLYQAPEIQQVFSIPITLIDGTSSMNREYKYIIQVYEQIFGDLLETQRIQYQYTTYLRSIKPYLNEGRGNLTKALTQLFQFMLSNQFPSQYVTLTLVTDGREPLDINAIKELCQQVKSHYTVQILCIAFGNQFPITLIDNLKESVENQDFKNQSLFQIERSEYQSFVQIQKELQYAFQQIRQKLIISPQNHFFNFDVYTSITLRQPQKYVAINQLFLACTNQEIIIGEKKLLNINSPICLLKFLKISIQNIYDHLDLDQIDQIIQEFQQAFQFFNQFIVNIESKEEYAQQLEIINLILKIIELIEFAYHYQDKLILQQYIEKFKYLINCDNPKDFKELLENSKISQFDGIFNNITMKIKKQFEILLNQNSNNNHQNYRDTFENFRTILTSSIKNFCQIFEKMEPLNLANTLQDFQILVGSLIQNSREVFFSEYFDISRTEQYQQLFQINEQFRYLQKLQTETVLKEIKFLNNQITTLNLENQNPINPYFQFSYLPLPNQNNFEQISEKYLILLIDKNEELKPYTDSFLKCYKEIFSKITQKKRLEIYWQNTPTISYKIANNQEFEKIEFLSFKQLLDSLKDQLQLKNKQIHLLILTDNEQSYEKLHLQLRFAQLSHYKFRIIYISIGMKILTYLENEIFQKIDQQYQYTYPYMKNIPKQQYNKCTNEQNQERRNNYLKILQEIANIIDITNF